MVEGADLIQPYDEATNGDNNIIFLEAGNYTVTANLTSKEIKIVKNEFYFTCFFRQADEICGLPF